MFMKMEEVSVLQYIKKHYCLERSIVLTDKHLVLTGSDGDGDCGVAMGYTNSNLGILGEPLMRAYCNVHDVDYKRIGFARTKTKA